MDHPHSPPEAGANVQQKLTALHAELPPAEQRILEKVIELYRARLADHGAQDLLDIPDAAELLDDVAGFRMPDDYPQPDCGPSLGLTCTITTTAVVSRNPRFC
jgi:CelD/BcsL family acetyltransferase involved in cellulose biosynthesis